mmetsp:Transcript_28660/g.39584  ORF Transcript_28660/g.39584 Transcript_28660/m.39584 type:complete len:209 (-) Transcript_28660:111-737(-)|eukprot:CAMPEP_0196588496 /NCGR_PEP_ID=MMETSP1081-20130531/60678_1 /TAXON_ID=36882 /ORGANISM="Pyramimonas amylifera, Strain CCMP720" /LENGTH=208 /DNA_ID=CAMNT_0041911001 /DNA_START=84 /DNA_END=710 /DNA_ORIENTATION=+
MADTRRDREELEKMLFFESAREQAESDYKKDNNDAHALTRWGGVLLELAHFRQGVQAVELIDESVVRLEMAIAINPKKHDALWCLGNALTSQGFLHSDSARANALFTKAKRCFERALAEEPRNESYKKAMELATKAPALHKDLQVQLAAQQQQQMAMGGAPGGGMSMGGEAAGPPGAEGSEYWWDVAGWVTLLGLATAYVVLARSTPK